MSLLAAYKRKHPKTKLRESDLMRNPKTGKVVSKKRHAAGKRLMKLGKAAKPFGRRFRGKRRKAEGGDLSSRPTKQQEVDEKFPLGVPSRWPYETGFEGRDPDVVKEDWRRIGAMSQEDRSRQMFDALIERKGVSAGVGEQAHDARDRAIGSILRPFGLGSPDIVGRISDMVAMDDEYDVKQRQEEERKYEQNRKIALDQVAAMRRFHAKRRKKARPAPKRLPKNRKAAAFRKHVNGIWDYERSIGRKPARARPGSERELYEQALRRRARGDPNWDS